MWDAGRHECCLIHMLLSQILIENVSKAKNEAKRVFVRTIAIKIAGEMSYFF